MRAFLYLAVMCLPIAASAAGQDTLTPGRWEAIETSRFSVKGQEGLTEDSPPHSKSFCMTSEEAAVPARHFARLNDDSDCSKSDMVALKGHVRMQARCTTDGLAGTIKVKGEYTATRYDLAIEVEGGAKDIAFHMSGTLRATHVGDCTGDEDEKDPG